MKLIDLLSDNIDRALITEFGMHTSVKSEIDMFCKFSKVLVVSDNREKVNNYFDKLVEVFDDEVVKLLKSSNSVELRLANGCSIVWVLSFGLNMRGKRFNAMIVDSEYDIEKHKDDVYNIIIPMCGLYTSNKSCKEF